MLNHIAYLQDAFPATPIEELQGYVIEGKGGWSTYSEYYEEVLLQKDDTYFIVDHGYCVMSDDNTAQFQPDMISEEEALEYLIRWEQEEKDRELREQESELAELEYELYLEERHP